MGFANLLSRLLSGKALSLSYYDEEFVVASVDRIRNFLSNRDCFNPVYIISVDRPSFAVNTITFINNYIPSVVESSSNLFGQDSYSSSLATFIFKFFALSSLVLLSQKNLQKFSLQSRKMIFKMLTLRQF